MARQLMGGFSRIPGSKSYHMLRGKSRKYRATAWAMMDDRRRSRPKSCRARVRTQWVALHTVPHTGGWDGDRRRRGTRLGSATVKYIMNSAERSIASSPNDAIPSFNLELMTTPQASTSRPSTSLVHLFHVTVAKWPT